MEIKTLKYYLVLIRLYFPLTTKKKSPTLIEFCNICANRFLNMWTGKEQYGLTQKRKWKYATDRISGLGLLLKWNDW